MKKSLISLIVLAAILALGATARRGVSSAAAGKEKRGPICYLKFDEGQGDTVKDSSGNNFHGKVLRLGKHSEWVQGKRRKALSFTGMGLHKNGGVRIPRLGKRSVPKGLTMQAWVKPAMNPNAGSSQNVIISTLDGDRGSGFRLHIFAYKNTPSGELIFHFGTDKKGQGGGGVTTYPKRMLEKGVWHHVAAVYDGSKVTIYVDGEEIATSKPGARYTPGTDYVTVGSYVSGTAYGWNGVIDEVKIYDYTRSPSDIARDGSSLFDIEPE